MSQPEFKEIVMVRTEADQNFERLSEENCALLLIDHQQGLCLCTQTQEMNELKNNVVALAELARLYKLPTVLTTSYSAGPNGALLGEITSMFPGQEIIDRTLVNAWDDVRFTDAVKATGRRKLIMAGISTEVCVAFPAIAALREGYDVYVAVDASATWTPRVEQASWIRMAQAGAVITNWVSLAAELQRDWAKPNGAALAGHFAKHFGPYGLLMR
jgi:nicotinamidase-related amidase